MRYAHLIGATLLMSASCAEAAVFYATYNGGVVQNDYPVTTVRAWGGPGLPPLMPGDTLNFTLNLPTTAIFPVAPDFFYVQVSSRGVGNPTFSGRYSIELLNSTLLTQSSVFGGTFNGVSGASPSTILAQPKFLEPFSFSGLKVTIDFDQGSSFDVGSVYLSARSIPEPATWAMLIVGFGLVGGAMRIHIRARQIG